MDGNFSDSSDQIENMVETTFRRMQNEYQSLLKTAIAHKDAQRYEKAGEVFAKAAKLLYSHQMDYTKVIKRYNDAAECFLRVKDGRAFNCYLSAIDIDVNKGVIEKAIENCFISGYKCDLELGDKYKAEELYKKGEELRHEHKLSHSCVITRFDKSKHGKDLNKALDIYEKFAVKIPTSEGYEISHQALCRRCIDAHQKLHHLIFSATRLHDEYQNMVIARTAEE